MSASKSRVNDKKKIIIAGLIFAVVIIGIGYLSISQSKYKNVSDLADVDRRMKVTVEGSVTPLGEGVFQLKIGSKVYTVEGYGSYGVVKGDNGETYGVFLMSDGDFVVLAMYDAGDNLSAYQAGSALSGNVVVSGVYDPHVKAVLTGPWGRVELPYLQVDTILKGCHSNYQQGVGTRS